MHRAQLGRWLRGHRASARALTEYRVRTLPRNKINADLRACLRHAESGTIAIDVGASVGNYAAAMARKVGPTGQVLALEPNPDVYAELALSTSGTSVVPLNLAASSDVGEATLSVPLAKHGLQTQLATLQPRSDDVTTVTVNCVPLDFIVELHRPVSVIKIDVEGHELAVIRGASQTIQRHRPALVIEIEARHTSPEDLQSTVSEVMGMGYECTGLSGDQEVDWAAFNVAEHQLQHLSSDRVSILPGHSHLYVNNFLFRPVAK